MRTLRTLRTLHVQRKLRPLGKFRPRAHSPGQKPSVVEQPTLAQQKIPDTTIGGSAPETTPGFQPWIIPR